MFRETTADSTDSTIFSNEIYVTSTASSFIDKNNFDEKRTSKEGRFTPAPNKQVTSQDL